MQRTINTEKHITTITPIKTPIFLGMETPGKTQDGKIGAAFRYRFYYEKIWSVCNIENSSKPGKCSYTAESLGKTPAKPRHPPA